MVLKRPEMRSKMIEWIEMIEEVDEEVSEPIEKQEIWQKESQEVERLDKAMREMRLAIREREREKRSVV